MSGHIVAFVVGTRPEAIKLAPVVRALRRLHYQPRLVLTGQHPDLNLAAYGLGDLPLLALDCAGMPQPHAHVGQVTRRLLPMLGAVDVLVVQGDTSSALAGALAGTQAGVPVAHVEAGLRTHDPANPWPEEEFRVAIDACARLLFAPTEVSAANLRAEKVEGDIEVTGNTAVDALIEIMPTLRRRCARRGSARRLLVTCHRRESWGEGLAGIAAALIRIAQAEDVEIRFVLHPNPRVAAQMRSLLEAQSRIRLIEPCSHRDMLQLMRDSDLVLSDSGGMQEEAPTLGVPLLVLREVTERPEGIASGNARIVGRHEDRIVDTVRDLLDDKAALDRMARPSMPYGDGAAAPRIAAAIDRWLEEGSFEQPERLRA